MGLLLWNGLLPCVRGRQRRRSCGYIGFLLAGQSARREPQAADRGRGAGRRFRWQLRRAASALLVSDRPCTGADICRGWCACHRLCAAKGAGEDLRASRCWVSALQGSHVHL